MESNQYSNAYDFTFGTQVLISFETGGYAHPDTIAFFKRFIKYGISDGTATEPAWTPQARTEYARRMHVVRTTLSIAIATLTLTPEMIQTVPPAPMAAEVNPYAKGYGPMRGVKRARVDE